MNQFTAQPESDPTSIEPTLLAMAACWPVTETGWQAPILTLDGLTLYQHQPGGRPAGGILVEQTELYRQRDAIALALAQPGGGFSHEQWLAQVRLNGQRSFRLGRLAASRALRADVMVAVECLNDCLPQQPALWTRLITQPIGYGPQLVARLSQFAVWERGAVPRLQMHIMGRDGQTGLPPLGYRPYELYAE